MANALLFAIVGFCLGTWVSRRRAVQRAVADAEARAAAKANAANSVVWSVDGRTLNYYGTDNDNVEQYDRARLEHPSNGISGGRAALSDPFGVWGVGDRGETVDERTTRRLNP